MGSVPSLRSPEGEHLPLSHVKLQRGAIYEELALPGTKSASNLTVNPLASRTVSNTFLFFTNCPIDGILL